MKYILSFLLVISFCSAEVNLISTSKKSDKVNLVLSQQCMFGDFDLVMHDMMYNKGLNLYLSLKEIDNDSEITVPILNEFLGKDAEKLEFLGYKEMSEKTKALLEKGYSIDLKNKLDPRKKYLISICSDSSNKPSCVNKNVEDISELLKIYQNPAKNYKPEDHIYFRQLLWTSKGKHLALKETVSEKNQSLLEKNIDESNLESLKKLGSLPLSFNEKSIVITLPLFSPKKCGKI